MRTIIVAGILAVNGVSASELDRSSFYVKYGAKDGHHHGDHYDDGHHGRYGSHRHHGHHGYHRHHNHHYHDHDYEGLDAETPIKELKELSASILSDLNGAFDTV